MLMTNYSAILLIMKNEFSKSKSNKITCIIFAFLLTILSLSGCESNNNQLSKSAVLFDTYITITIYEGGSADLLNECIDICTKYDKLFSPSYQTSDIAKINASGGQPVNVSYETMEVIEDSLQYCALTDGLFDISIYPVTSLWDFKTDNPSLPNDEELQSAIANVDYKSIQLDKDSSTITLINPNAAIDVGSIAKGFFADKIKNYLIQNGVKSAIINLGGDIAVIGKKDKNTPFNIGISDPNSKDDILCSAHLDNINIATSGTYERCFEINNEQYHHILNPHTGYPVQTDITSVSVVSSSAEKADALCTVCILLGSDQAKVLIDKTDDAECLIVKNDKSIIASEGIDKYITLKQ